jgi:hypothetical protein
MGIFISSFPGAIGIGAHFRWKSPPTWAKTYCFSNEERVWSKRSIISFQAKSKVWITEIKSWIYWSGASV